MFGHGKLLASILLVGRLLSADYADAGTLKAASCSQDDVQAAIDAASDGDIVEVPTGTATWTTTSSTKPAVLISEKTITLQGAGIDKTIILDETGYPWKDLLLWISGTKPARITGFTFKGFIERNRGAAAVAVRGNCRNWRIDHCKFDGSPRGVWAYAGCFGVVDNCIFLNTGQGVVMKGYGDESWKRPLTLGLADALYVEDCTFKAGGAATDAYHGARFVFRRNSLVDTHVAQHGCDSGNYRSTFSYEVYDNVIAKEKLTASRVPRAMHFRGGTGVVFNNTLAGFSEGIDVANYRSSERFRKLCGKWGICDGKNPVDGNEEPNGYPARDQIGRSTNQVLEPLYEWNNTLDGKDADVHVSTGTQHIGEGRDFHNDTPRPGYRPYAYPHPLRAEWPPAPPKDHEAPTVPVNLTVHGVSGARAELTWQPSTDNEGVMGYYVWLDGRRVSRITAPACTKYTLPRLKAPTGRHTFSVSAFDAAGNESRPSSPTETNEL
ncbi:MAG: hypothetical protein ACYTG0_46015 [Planctomycetota bacterium]|jgi:hypothetical protein